MFQNDVSYAYCDFDADDFVEIEAKINKLIETHESESIAAPYFFIYELEGLEEELPEGWSIEISEDSCVDSNKVRVTIYNCYPEAARSFDDDISPVTLKGSLIGGGIVAISSIDQPVGTDELLELDSACGESPILICVTPGESYGASSEEFSIAELEDAVRFIKGLRTEEEEKCDWFTSDEATGLTRPDPPLTGESLIAFMKSCGDKPEHVICYEAGYILERPDGMWTGDMASLMTAML